MKSTYKLLGAFWDNMPCEDKNPKIYTNSTAKYAYRILLSQLLSSQSVDDVEQLLAQNEFASSVIVTVDYTLNLNNKTINVFYEKRIRQISAYLKLHFDEVYFCQE